MSSSESWWSGSPGRSSRSGSDVTKLVLELADKLVGVVVVREGSEGLGGLVEALLEVAEFESEEGPVEEGLEHVGRHLLHSGEVCARRVHVALAQLEHAEVGVALHVIRVHRDGHLEGLVGEAQVADADGHLSDVEPDVAHLLVGGEGEGAVECGEAEVVLGGVEAAERQVVPHLAVVHAQLQQAAVEAQRHLRLVRVEVVRREARQGLHVRRVQGEGALVVADGLRRVVERVAGARLAHDHRDVPREGLRGLGVRVECCGGLVQPQVDAGQFEVGKDGVLGLERRAQLLLRVPVEAELEVALAQALFPPPVAEGGGGGGQGRELEGLLGVVVHVQNVFEESACERRPLGILLQVELVRVDEGAAATARAPRGEARRAQAHEAAEGGHGPRGARARACHGRRDVGGRAAATRIRAGPRGPGAGARKARGRAAAGRHGPHARIDGPRSRPRHGTREARARPRHGRGRIVVKQDVRHALLVHLHVIHPRVHGQGPRLEEPRRLIVGLGLEEGGADRRGRAVVAAVEARDRDEERVHARGHMGHLGHAASSRKPARDRGRRGRPQGRTAAGRCRGGRGGAAPGARAGGRRG
mmetsp:Transcript_3456/g.9947  ORF Transcript_3456/g.9947 Transcript_3456/m.9947 type:complete len:588 (+) Transcript_3456:203-1966(+)